MGELTNKAEELTGRAKQAAGDLTDNDGLRAEGAADTARAQVKQGVDTVVDKAQDAVDAVSEAASDGANAVAEKVDDVKHAMSTTADEAAHTARQFHLDDARVQIALVGGLALVVALVVRRVRGTSHSTKRSIAKGAAIGGLSSAFNH